MANPTDFPPVSGSAAALYAWDGTNWVKVSVSASGLLEVDTVVVQSTNADKIEGIESVVITEKQNLNAVGGVNTLVGDNVPAGKLWKITHVSAANSVSAVTAVNLYATDGVSNLILHAVGAVAAGITTDVGRDIWLPAGWHLVAIFGGCTVGDDLYLDYNGIQMDAT